MATITTPHSFTVGETVTATNLDTLVQALQFLINGTPACFAGQTSTQSIAYNTWTTIILQTAVFDTDSGLNTSTGVYTAQTAGWFFVTGSVNFSNATNTDGRAIRFVVNGAATVTGMAACQHSDINTALTFSRLVYLGKGDTLAVQAWHDTGVTTTPVAINTAVNTAGGANERSMFSLQFISA